MNGPLDGEVVRQKFNDLEHAVSKNVSQPNVRSCMLEAVVGFRVNGVTKIVLVLH